MSPSRTCSPATIPAGSLSWSQAPTYRACPSVTMRTSVRSVTGAPSCSSRCTNPVTGVASSHAESVRRPSMTGGVTTARAVAVREAAAPGAGIWPATSSTGNGSPMSSASAANLCDIRDAKPGRGEAPAAGYISRRGLDLRDPKSLHITVTQRTTGEPPPWRSWEDVVNVPPRATVRIAWLPDDRTGSWMYDCHILEHHTAGMMAHFDIVP